MGNNENEDEHTDDETNNGNSNRNDSGAAFLAGKEPHDAKDESDRQQHPADDEGTGDAGKNKADYCADQSYDANDVFRLFFLRSLRCILLLWCLRVLVAV